MATQTFTVKVLVDKKQILQKIEKRMDGVQAKLDAAVLKDSNFYCPHYTGTLQKSGIIHTELGSGWIQWQTDYAREQYYGKPNKSHNHNPNACMKWFEAAKARWCKKWEKIANDSYHKGN